MTREKLLVSNPVLGSVRVESDDVARTLENCGSKAALFFGKLAGITLLTCMLKPVAKKTGGWLASLIDEPKKQNPAGTPPSSPSSYEAPKTMQQILDEAIFDSDEQRHVAGGLLRKDTHMLLAAAQKTGKSMLMMEIARSAATGTSLSWLPQHMQTACQQPMHVVYYDGEMKADDYQPRYGKASDNFPDNLLIVTDTPKGIHPFFDRMERDLDPSKGDTLVLIDNYSAIGGEYTPNAAGEYRQRMAALQEQFRRQGNTLTFISAFHTTKEDAEKHYGSSHFANLSDGQIYLKQDAADPDCLILTMPCCRGANPLKGESIRLKRVQQPYLHFELQPAISAVDPEPTAPPKSGKEQRNDEIRRLKEEGLTNCELAEKYGMSERNVQIICNGKGNRA